MINSFLSHANSAKRGAQKKMRENGRVYDENGEVKSYYFTVDFPKGLSSEIINTEVDWILDQVRELLSAEEMRDMERRGYTIKKEKTGSFSADILITLDKEDK